MEKLGDFVIWQKVFFLVLFLYVDFVRLQHLFFSNFSIFLVRELNRRSLAYVSIHFMCYSLTRNCNIHLNYLRDIIGSGFPPGWGKVDIISFDNILGFFFCVWLSLWDLVIYKVVEINCYKLIFSCFTMILSAKW